jgi:hypothetical protein
MTDNIIIDFFERFEKASSSADTSEIASLYADTFLFGIGENVQAIKKADFLKALPHRVGFFARVGLKKTSLGSVTEEGKLAENYFWAKVSWKMEYAKEGRAVIEDTISASYILLKKGTLYQIVLQIDHQDLMHRVQSLGLI